MGYKPEKGEAVDGAKLAEQYHVLNSLQLTNCSTCHH